MRNDALEFMHDSAAHLASEIPAFDPFYCETARDRRDIADAARCGMWDLDWQPLDLVLASMVDVMLGTSEREPEIPADGGMSWLHAAARDLDHAVDTLDIFGERALTERIRFE